MRVSVNPGGCRLSGSASVSLRARAGVTALRQLADVPDRFVEQVGFHFCDFVTIVVGTQPPDQDGCSQRVQAELIHMIPPR
jgi:hypothetical protein